MNLGRFELCLIVADLEASASFYTKLGFRRMGGSERFGILLLENGNCRLGLYQGLIAENLLNFRGGNIPKIAEQARSQGLTFEREPFVGSDGGMAALLRDPDGNAIYLVSHPEENS